MKNSQNGVNTSGKNESKVFAREYTLDIPKISSVELPLKVSSRPESVQKAVHMCGGLSHIKDVMLSQEDSGLELRLNPEKDEGGIPTFFNEHPIIGRRVPNRDESIILKISMPKGTLARHGNDLQKAIANSTEEKKLRVLPVAIINNSIRFRSMSDFQIRLDNVPSAKEYNRSVPSLNWSNLKQYVNTIQDSDPRPFENINKLIIDRESEPPSWDWQLPPIPRFSMVNIPYVYKYTGNPYAKKSESGESSVKGTYIKNYQQLVYDFGMETPVPTEPHPELVKTYSFARESGLYPGTGKDVKFLEKLETCMSILGELFERRPIWVKRHIDGIVPIDLHPTLKVALSLKSYRFTKGPWRNSYIKLGVDPRVSDRFACYQTEYFKIERKLLHDTRITKNLPPPPPKLYQTSDPGKIDPRFFFDGKRIPWYLMLQIDLLSGEPNIAEVLSEAKYLDEVNELTGWFTELDLTKIRKIVKYELGCMVQGNFEFNEHKLKFFKRMVYVRESMMKDQDGDVDMDDGQEGTPDLDDDNGVEEGELDDAILEEAEENEEEEANINAKLKTTDSVVSELQQDNFDPKRASFKEMIERIEKYDPEAANYLKSNLGGVIQGENI